MSGATPSVLYGASLGSLTWAEFAPLCGNLMFPGVDGLSNLGVLDVPPAGSFGAGASSFATFVTYMNESQASYEPDRILDPIWSYDAINNRFIATTLKVGSLSYISFPISTTDAYRADVATLLGLTQPTGATITQGFSSTDIPNPVGLTTRLLLPRVKIYREDVNESHCLFAIQEAVREICRYSGLAIEHQYPIPLLANTHLTTIQPYNNNNLLRVIKITAPHLPGSTLLPTQYLGTFDPGNGNIFPAFIPPTGPSITTITSSNYNLFPTNGFFTSTGSGKYIISSVINPLGLTTPWNTGDVIIANTGEWNQYKTDDFIAMIKLPKPNIDNTIYRPQGGRSWPTTFAQEGNSIFWYSPPQFDTMVQITLSYVPTGEITTIPLPVDAEDVIVDGAIATIFRLPGEGKDFKMSEFYDIKFKKGLTKMRAMGLYGYSGVGWYVPGNIVGRSSRWIPRISNIGWWA